MAGPFPGMDPYLELQESWPDFHNRLISEICNELGGSLPGSYVAGVDERIYVRGANQVNYGRIAEVMSIITAAGYKKVALVTDPNKN